MASSPRTLLMAVILLFAAATMAFAQDYADEPTQPRAVESCNGIFLTYTFTSRSKEYPHVKNASAQAYAFKSIATVLNAGKKDLPAWKMFIGFQHDEVLVSAPGAVLTEGTDMPALVGNGTYLSGYPQADLKNSIETAGDLTQIMVQVELSGTQFGVKPPGVPMPKTIKLANAGYKCPSSTRHASQMYVCCVWDPKIKRNKTTSTKFQPRRDGDLTIAYDVLQAFEANYLAQVTLNNSNPLGRLDNWNLTWEWKRGEFINNMRGAYALKKDPSPCIFGDAGAYYKDMDFSTVASCEKKPILVDLPPERANDTQGGKLPYCCKNGTLLPPNMDPEKSMAIFQLQVNKVPPDLNRTALHCPQNWKINGVLNPDYKCGPPVRVSPSEFPDTSGLLTRSLAIASWQVVCNITRPKKKRSQCCVSYSAFYNDSVIPAARASAVAAATAPCNPNASPLLLPPEALLIPFDNRTAKAKAWAKIKHRPIPNPLPCGDHCGVSINWHVFSNYAKGWTARITLFNWDDYTFKDWFAAVQLKDAFKGYEKAYSFNGTKLPEKKNTIFFQGLPGLNYLMAEVDGKNKHVDPRVPGKQQSVISFTKKQTRGINIVAGDGFPSRVYFNGEECALPGEIPRGDARRRYGSGFLVMVVTLVVIVLVLTLDNLW